MKKFGGCTLLALLLNHPAAASSPPPPPLSLAPVFSDDMVLQRDVPVPVTGRAGPGAQVSVGLGNDPDVITRADAQGRWRADLPARAATVSTTLTVRSGGTVIRLVNVAVGDVFLCSGQSNMEFPLRLATNADVAIAQSGNAALRLFNVPRQSSTVPQTTFGGPAAWRPAGPQSSRDFSAACYFMGQALQDRRQVPVGLIAASWGGSIIQDWLSEAGLRKTGDFDQGLDLLKLRQTDPAAAQKRWEANLQRYMREATRQAGPPMAIDPSRFWEEQSADLATFDGTGIYTTGVTLDAAQARQGGRIFLGAADDIDQTLIGDVPVGSTTGWNVERVYNLAPGVLRPGMNRIEVRVLDTGGGGGLWGRTARRIELADGSVVPLDGAWQFRRGAPLASAGPPPYVPWIGGNGLTTLFNGMIAPLGDIPLAGIAWYQGESNVGDPVRYPRWLRGLMADWRGRFSTRRFAIVQLANYGPLRSAAGPSDWAALRETQRATVAADPDAGLAVTIDIGDPRDIHPANKKDVGLRLALAMERGDQARLPQLVRQGGQLLLRFDHPLHVIGALTPIGFEVCGAPGCRFVSVRLADDNTLAIALEPGDREVRYLWAESPIANLYDRSGLPVTPFLADIPS